MRKLFSSLLLLLIISSLPAQQMDIVPRPKSIKQPRIAGSFIITPATQIVLEGSNMTNAVNFFNDYLQRFYLFKLKVTKTSTSKNVIRLNYERMDNEIPGAYNMTVDGKGIYIAGDNEDGVFYGIQTLIQLLPVPEAGSKIRRDKLNIPYVAIEDAPRFAYRGMHLDCSRHFWPVDFVKKYIDYLALHKFNKFHWHLTDDQGWRIEIKKYPKLTGVGGWRNGTIIGRYPGTGNDGIKYGGYYTQEQIKEIVKYAAGRYIDVIPEIEMPGHSSAAIAAYPELSCFPDEPTIKYFPKQCVWSGDSTGKQVQQTWGVFDDVFCAGQEKTFSFLKDVMDEVLALFPSRYIHVGGDECPKENWKRCPHCQKRIKENNLKDEHELQSYFIQRMEKYLNNNGRILIGWDEILEGGLAPNAVVMSWRGEAGGIEAAKQKHNVIMTPGNPVYFDHTQSENEDSVTIGGYNPIEKVYAYEPIPKELNEEEGKYVLGAQANLWTEYIKNTKKVEYMIFPRMAALSEVLWSKKENKNWNDFEKRLMTQFKRYDLWKGNYSKAYFDLKTYVLPATNHSGIIWKIESKFKNDSIFFTEARGLPKPIKYTEPVLISETSNKHVFQIFNGNKTSSITQQFHINKATGKKIILTTPPSKTYPGDGAFTLVNGVQNEKGMSKSKEFLGFSGDDCIAIIDLGKEESISFVKVYYLHQPSSWIHQPSAVSVSVSTDGNNFQPVAISNPTIANNEAINEFLQPANTRYIKVYISNFGIIPSGNPGAGSKAWLFVDEIEIN
ncbi:MAG TPA: family 20 glycosylhydrolase [Chitinophagaceae bacterium]|nr:family 20 glycosylhydrolase [Chitinophagaceae bacterium]